MLATADGYGRWEDRECTLQPGDERKRVDISRCTLGTGPRVLVLGNSLSAAFVQGFEPFVKAGWSVSVISAWGASPVSTIKSEAKWAEPNSVLWGQVAPEALSGLARGDSVLLLSDMYWVDETKIDLLERGLRRLASDLRRRGIDLWIVDSLPNMRDTKCEPEAAVKQWFNPFGVPCNFPSKRATLERRAAQSDLLLDLEEEGLLQRIDLLDSFCPAADCSYNAGGIMMYRDDAGHPSVEAMSVVGPLLLRSLGKPGENGSLAVRRGAWEVQEPS